MVRNESSPPVTLRLRSAVAKLACASALLVACAHQPGKTHDRQATRTDASASSQGGGPAIPQPDAASWVDAPPSDDAFCDAPLPTVGQRWHEQFTMTMTPLHDAGPDAEFVDAEPRVEDLVIEVQAVEGRMPTRIRRAQRVGTGWAMQVDGDALPELERGIDAFSMGRGGWSAVVPDEFLSATDAGNSGWRNARKAMQDSLASRLKSEFQTVRLRLAQPVQRRFDWGEAIVFPARVHGETGSVAAGEWTSETFELRGELTTRVGDGAFVSLLLTGAATIVVSWRTPQGDGLGRTYSPPVKARVVLRLERPCFMTSLRGQKQMSR